MNIREIAEHLQRDLMERPHEKVKKFRKGRELPFVLKILRDFGYQLPGKKIRTLAAKAKTYEAFILSATK